MFDVTWRKHGTSFVISDNTPDRYFFRNILRPTKSFYDFRFQSYGSKGDFHGFRYVWPWPWHFKVIWLLKIHLVFPCMTGVNFDLWPWRFEEIRFFFIFFSFSLKSRDAKHFAANQKSAPLPVQKLWPIMWFSLNLLVTWRKNVTSQKKRNSIRNVLHPTRSLCHFRFKSYGQLSDFHKSGDLDLALHPIFKK